MPFSIFRDMFNVVPFDFPGVTSEPRVCRFKSDACAHCVGAHHKAELVQEPGRTKVPKPDSVLSRVSWLQIWVWAVSCGCCKAAAIGGMGALAGLHTLSCHYCHCFSSPEHTDCRGAFSWGQPHPEPRGAAGIPWSPGCPPALPQGAVSAREPILAERWTQVFLPGPPKLPWPVQSGYQRAESQHSGTNLC